MKGVRPGQPNWKAVKIGHSPVTVSKCLSRICYVPPLAVSVPASLSESPVTPTLFIQWSLLSLNSGIWHGWSLPTPVLASRIPDPLVSLQLPQLAAHLLCWFPSCPCPLNVQRPPVQSWTSSVSQLTPLMMAWRLMTFSIIHVLRFLKFVPSA